MDNEIIYIPYGQDEISQQDLMTSLANGVAGYLDSKRWAKKDKYRQAWLNAYQNIINRGITGASNDSGLWKIKHKGEDFNLNEMSNTEREMYQDAAYYIRNQMSQLPTRKKLEEEQNKEKNKEKEAKKTNYDNKQFQGGLTSYVSNLDYGGKESKEWIYDWIKLDPETNGIYGREKRQAKLAEYLKGYRDKLEQEQDKWDFSKGPYGSYEEFNNRINAAVEALKNPEWNSDDIDALNRLGLDREAWLSNGENVLVPLTDQNGNVVKNVTRAEYNALLEEQNKKIEEVKAKEEEEKKKKELEEQQKKLNQMRYNINKYNLISRANPSSPYLTSQFQSFQSLDSLTDYLENKYMKWDPSYIYKDRDQLSGAYRLLYNNNRLKQISEDEFNKYFSKSKFKLNKENLFKLDKLNNIFYDKSDNQIYILSSSKPSAKEDVLSKQYKTNKMLNNIRRYDALTLAMKKGGTINNLDIIIEDFFKKSNNI